MSSVTGFADAGQRLAFAPSMLLDRQQFKLRNLPVEHAMRRSLLRGEFFLVYQPIVDAQTRQCVKLEALTRWRRPVAGYEGPDRFIPVAEQSSLIVELGQWVVDESLRQLAQWQQHGPTPVISINVSARQFADPYFSSRLMNSVQLHQLDPSRLELEVTESVLVQDASQTRMKLVLNSLCKRGFGLALDDFGTGYASFGYLDAYDFTTLKIDRRFIQGVDSNPRNQALVRGMVVMGHGLDMKVVAEGVETEAEAQWLLDCGCDYLQGYLLGRPTEASALPSFC